MRKSNMKYIMLSAMFLAIGFVLPFFTGQLKEIGDTLLPMHIPVMLCGLICGAKYGLAVGFILPFFRSVTVGMPPIYPNAVWMAVELLTYGFIIGFFYKNFHKKRIWWLYCCLAISMISGRITWGIAKTILLGVAGKAFTLEAFLIGGFIDAFPGIVLQLVLIPVVMRLKDIFFKKTEREGK